MAELGKMYAQEDPRSPLEKARRVELLAYAKDNGIDAVRHDMPAPLIRKILIANNCTNIPVPPRQLGAIGRTVVAPTMVTKEGINRARENPQLAQSEQTVVGEVNADDALERAYIAQQRFDMNLAAALALEAQNAPPTPPTTVSPSAEPKTMAELRAEVKARGLSQPKGASAAQLTELLKNDGNVA
jgi:hypothetical protein